MSRNVLVYLVVLVVFGAALHGLLQVGANLPAGGAALAGHDSRPAPGHDATERGLASVLYENLRQPLGVLLLQLIVIVLAARGMGAVFARIGQPPVIGEMVAGILLGPSLLGLLYPPSQDFLFPASSMGSLRVLSQVGVIIFMFIVGMELDVNHLRDKAHTAVLVSHASTIVPFFLGSAFSIVVYTRLAPAGISFTAFALFMGVAMSITAFPVLARIIEERGLARTELGNAAIACAAVGDVLGWCMLALVISLVTASSLFGAALTVVLSLVFIGVMLFVVKPLAARFAGRELRSEGGSKVVVACVLALVFAAAFCTEIIGIHALFGAFMAGVVMPDDQRLRHFFRERLESFGSAFLLPLFFAFTGLRTEIGLLADWQSWLMCAGVIAVAVAGKLGGSMAAARWTGMSWRDSFAIGTLMNTRGLMELIVLTIGYDLGILSPPIFAMMVLMALTTTFLTGPLLALLGPNLGQTAHVPGVAVEPEAPTVPSHPPATARG